MIIKRPSELKPARRAFKAVYALFFKNPQGFLKSQIKVEMRTNTSSEYTMGAQFSIALRSFYRKKGTLPTML